MMTENENEEALGKWVPADGTVEADDLLVGIMRTGVDGEEEPEKPNGIVILMKVTLAGVVPVSLVAKLPLEDAITFRQAVDTAVQMVQLGVDTPPE